MYDSMMIWTDDHLITRIVVQAFYEIVNMMRLDNMGTEGCVKLVSQIQS